MKTKESKLTISVAFTSLDRDVFKFSGVIKIIEIVATRAICYLQWMRYLCMYFG